ncbi:MAG: hypothetical protein JWR54_501, partial [Mucilaginibacter sp.]|nr:hypothetical protein [Mucilaginibacter sp.]
MHHNYKYALGVVTTLALFILSKTVKADVITDWNLITVKTTKV